MRNSIRWSRTEDLLALRRGSGPEPRRVSRVILANREDDRRSEHDLQSVTSFISGRYGFLEFPRESGEEVEKVAVEKLCIHKKI